MKFNNRFLILIILLSIALNFCAELTLFTVKGKFAVKVGITQRSLNENEIIEHLRKNPVRETLLYVIGLLVLTGTVAGFAANIRYIRTALKTKTYLKAENPVVASFSGKDIFCLLSQVVH